MYFYMKPSLRSTCELIESPVSWLLQKLQRGREKVKFFLCHQTVLLAIKSGNAVMWLLTTGFIYRCIWIASQCNHHHNGTCKTSIWSAARSLPAACQTDHDMLLRKYIKKNLFVVENSFAPSQIQVYCKSMCFKVHFSSTIIHDWIITSLSRIVFKGVICILLPKYIK